MAHDEKPNLVDNLNAKWKEVPKSEDPEILLSEAFVSAYREIEHQNRLSTNQKAKFISALDTVKHEGIKNLSENSKTIEYFNQIGGAKNLVLHLALGVLADTVESTQELEDILEGLTFMLWHVPSEFAIMKAERRLGK